MLKYFNYDIVFQEVPNEVTLAVNFSLCPNHCRGCHSPWLWQDKGEIFDVHTLESLIKMYHGNFTCLAFMGGDNDPQAINDLAHHIKQNFPHINISNFDYIKIGPYKEECGSLKDKNTNQRFYKFSTDGKEDITHLFQKK